jgi:hypothetical protein
MEDTRHLVKINYTLHETLVETLHVTSLHSWTEMSTINNSYKQRPLVWSLQLANAGLSQAS